MTAPVLSAVPSRTSGVAPLAVFLDCTATTGVTMHTGLFTHKFGDPNGETWAYGANTGWSKNYATGIVAAHVYETPGTYTITSIARNSDGEVDVVENEITVSDPDVQWAGDKTVCISSSGNFTGAPSGCVQVTSSNATTAVAANIGSGDKRILFRRGETFTAAAAVVLNQAGPGYVGAFGTGAKPIIQGTTNNTDYGVISVTGGVEDWRVADVQLVAATLAQNKVAGIRGNGLMNKLTVLRVDINGTFSGITLPESALSAEGVWTDVAVVDSTLRNFNGGNGGNGSYLDVENLMWLGNDLDDTMQIEHGLRIASCVKGVIANSNFSRAATNKVVFTLRAPNFAGSTPIPAGTYTEYIVISDNVFTPSTLQLGNVGVGPLGVAYDGRLRNIIFERNFFDYAVGGIMQIQLSMTASDVTLKNNIVRTLGQTIDSRIFQIAMENEVVGYPVPNNIALINNTGLDLSTGTTKVFLYQITTEGTPTNISATNNIHYAPNATSASLTQGGSVTSTTNTTNSITQDPEFASATPSIPADFRINTASYAADGGTAQFPAQNSDFFNCRDKTGDNRIGALVPRVNMQCSGVPQ